MPKPFGPTCHWDEHRHFLVRLLLGQLWAVYSVGIAKPLASFGVVQSHGVPPSCYEVVRFPTSNGYEMLRTRSVGTAMATRTRPSCVDTNAYLLFLQATAGYSLVCPTILHHVWTKWAKHCMSNQLLQTAGWEAYKTAPPQHTVLTASNHDQPIASYEPLLTINGHHEASLTINNND